MSRLPFRYAINRGVRPWESTTSRPMTGAYSGRLVIFAWPRSAASCHAIWKGGRERESGA
jgi:hypothetical protein